MVSVVCILDRSGRCRGPNSGECCMYTRQVGGGVQDQTVVSVVCILDRWGRCTGPNSGECCMYTRQVGEV